MHKHLLLQQSLRRKELSKLKFPFSNIRTGQKEMMLSVLQHLNEKKALLLQAPTGIGKTLGTLFPALKSLHKGFVTHIFYATAKQSTRQVVLDALHLLREKNHLRIQSILLATQEELCTEHEQLCQPSFVPPLSEMDEKWLEALEDLLTHEHIDKKILLSCAEKWGFCAYELMQAVCPLCDVIIGDYNHIFDPYAKLRTLLRNKHYKLALLIDEAHNLPQRAQEMFSASLRFSDFYPLSLLPRQNIDRTLQEILEDWKNYFRSLHQALLENEEENLSFCALEKAKDSEQIFAFQNFRATYQFPEELLKLLQKTKKHFALLQAFASSTEKTTYAFKIFKKKVENMLLLAEHFFGDGFFLSVEKEQHEPILKIQSSEWGDALSSAYENRHTPIFFSASLDPLHYYHQAFSPKSTLQNAEDFLAVQSLPSPFPTENFCVLLSNYLKTDFENRHTEAEKLAKSIKTALLSKKGNYILYFPSFKYQQMFAPLLVQDVALQNNFHFLFQKSKESFEEKQAFLSAFRNDYEKNTKQKCALGFAVLGGSYGEGIDLEGKRLSGVIILGLGLPYPTPSLEMKKLYLDEKYEEGFNFIYRYPGFNKILQAAGRVIRTENDKGFVFFCDSRLNHALYHALWPTHWHIQLVQNEKDLQKRLQAFYQGQLLPNLDNSEDF